MKTSHIDVPHCKQGWNCSLYSGATYPAKIQASISKGE